MAHGNGQHQRSRPLRRRKGERGFTLLEALVGLAILSAVLIASYSAVSSALRTAYRVAERREAVAKVQEKADELRQQPFLRPATFQGETDGYQWHVTLERLQAPAGRLVVPVRIVGWLTGKGTNGRSETVVDMIVLGKGS